MPLENTQINNKSEHNQNSANSSYVKQKIKNLLDYVWPIRNSELPKFLFITLLMFCILCIQNLIRALKDSIINTMIATETISFLKFWGVMPAAFLITILYVKLVNTMKGENIFYLVMSVFLAFFAIFAFYIFPNHQELHLNSDATARIINAYPNFKWFILLASNWSFSLFYIIAELWPNAVFALLFWQFVNKVTSVEESKRFYPLFGLLGQTGLYLTGKFLENLEYINKFLTQKFDLNSNFHTFSVQLILSIVLGLGVLALVTFWLLNHKILSVAKLENLKFQVKKQNIGLVESFKMVSASRYIRLITIMLICYGVAINLVEGPWKATATATYKNPTDYAAFVGSYLSYTGVFTLIFVVIGSNIVRRLGWFAAAIITPIMVFVTGMLFFSVANFKQIAFLMTTIFVFTDPTLIAITIGAVQNVLSKSSKYTLFDSTKEMAYVPLDDELKTKGKAAADVIGTKLGKSISALLQSLIFMIVPAATYSSISIYLMCIFTIMCLIWIWGTFQLDKEYKNLTSNEAK